MTKIHHTFFAGILTLFTLTHVHAETARTSRAVGHSGKTTGAVVRAEKLHPSANLSYKVAGRRYYPQKNVEGFSQTGRASWYGPGFHGKRTSSGERFDMNEMTAAHPTLPIPSYARITNLKNGRSVVVRINDRGPFHGNRVVDLSRAAAKQLGFLANGTANVRVEALKAGDTITPPVQTAKNTARTVPVKRNDTAVVHTPLEPSAEKIDTTTTKQVSI